MSLTRKEYIEMWEAIKRLELLVNDWAAECHAECHAEQCIDCKETINAVNLIKDKIQQVIGQME